MSSFLPSAIKQQIRTEVKRALRDLPLTTIADESEACSLSLFSTSLYLSSKAISVYLSMPTELQTKRVIEDALASQKRVFIPKVVGKASNDMVMIEIASLEEIDSFPKSKWGIPEPNYEEGQVDGTNLGVIDLIVVPGVAFDRSCGRVGHGKGYYDSFIVRSSDVNQSMGKAPPSTIALSLSCQLLESVPMDIHDRRIDCLITPTAMYTPSAVEEPASV